MVHRTCFFLPDQYPIVPSVVNIPSFLWEITPPIFSSLLVPTKLTSISLLDKSWAHDLCLDAWTCRGF